MDRKLFRTIVLSGIMLIIAAFIILRYEGFFAVLRYIVATLRPITAGCIIAFVLNKPLEKTDCFLKNIYMRKGRTVSEKPLKTSVMAVYLITLLILGAIVGIIVPQLISNITVFASSFDTYYQNFRNIIDTLSGYLQYDWIKELDILDNLGSISGYFPDIIKKTFSLTADIFAGIIDFFVGMVLSVYILSDKKNLQKQADFLLKRIFSKNMYNKIMHCLKIANISFSNFISGQLTESLIVGVLCFIGMNIFGFKYSLMISIIIGITNIIPIAGPIFATIPCAFILLLDEPIKAVWFVVFIIVLQQLESNLIYPRVVGNSVGLPALWVLAAVTIGGRLYGITGMIVGIPLMSIVYGILYEKMHENQA